MQLLEAALLLLAGCVGEGEGRSGNKRCAVLIPPAGRGGERGIDMELRSLLRLGADAVDGAVKQKQRIRLVFAVVAMEELGRVWALRLRIGGSPIPFKLLLQQIPSGGLRPQAWSSCTRVWFSRGRSSSE